MVEVVEGTAIDFISFDACAQILMLRSSATRPNRDATPPRQARYSEATGRLGSRWREPAHRHGQKFDRKADRALQSDAAAKRVRKMSFQIDSTTTESTVAAVEAEINYLALRSFTIRRFVAPGIERNTGRYEAHRVIQPSDTAAASHGE